MCYRIRFNFQEEGGVRSQIKAQIAGEAILGAIPVAGLAAKNASAP